MELYIGIDIGKTSHHACLISSPLLKRHKSPLRCPLITFENTRAGFDTLLTAIRKYGEPGTTYALMEHTGHYGAALEQYLRDAGVTLYRMHHAQRYANNKTDRLDAVALASLLYNQEQLGIIHADEQQRIAPLIAPSQSAQLLRTLVQRRDELAREITQRKNQLISIADEIFPELTQIYKDTTGKAALRLREAFPTPESIASADLADLLKTRTKTRPAKAAFPQLQELARQTIGMKDAARVSALVFEQRQLIDELRMLDTHAEQLDARIAEVLAASREGRILLSFVGIGSSHAATILAGIGSIGNFESAAKLKSFLGWSPRVTQTGTTKDSTTLKRAGSRLLRKTLCLVAWSAINHDPTWQAEYTRLVDRMCPINLRTGKRIGKAKVIGHICGQIARVIYTLLRRDYDVLQTTPGGATPPEPELYSVEKHTARGLEDHEHTPVDQTPTTVTNCGM